MRITSAVRASAVVTTLALIGLAASPALAASPVAQASATGLTLTIAGNGSSTGSYAVTNDGTKETATGSDQPALGLLGNQSFVSAGTLAQGAKTTVTGGAGSSAACSGLAGQGASLAAVGSGNCLAGGNALTLTPAALNLNKIADITLVQGQTFSSLNGLLAALGVVNQVTPLLTSLQTALDTALAPLAGSGLVIGAGAIQSSCTASIGTADGTANIANAGAYVQLPAFAGQPATRVDLLNFPASPPPNTDVLVNLDKVTATIITALQTSLNTSAASGLGAIPGLAGILAGLGQTAQQIQTQLVTNIVAQLQPVLAPLSQNVLKGTLNKQVKPTPDQITVTALDLQVLPALQAQLGYSLLGAEIGKSSCGPSGRLAVAPTTTPKPTPKPPKTNKPNPNVPTSVPAGLADAPSRNAPLGPWALAGLGLLMGVSAAAGTMAYRRSARS